MAEILNRTECCSGFASLSSADLVHCISFLEDREIAAVEPLHSTLRAAGKSEKVWRNLYLKRWHFGNKKNESLGRDAYIKRHLTERGLQEGRTGQYEVKTCRGHSNYIKQIRLRGPLLATCSADNSVQVYECGTGGRRSLTTLRFEAAGGGGDQAVGAMAFNGFTVAAGASGSEGNILVASVAERKQAMPPPWVLGTHSGGVTCLCFLGNNSLLSGGATGDICRWDLDQKILTQTLRGSDTVDDIIVLGEGKILAVGPSNLKVWNMDSDQLLAEEHQVFQGQVPPAFGGLFEPASSYLGCFCVDGKIVAVKNDGKLQEYCVPDQRGTFTSSPAPLISETWSSRSFANQNDYTQCMSAFNPTAVACSDKHLIFGGASGSILVFQLRTLRRLRHANLALENVCHQGLFAVGV